MTYNTQNRLTFFSFLKNGYQISKREKTHYAILAFALLYASQVNGYITFLLCKDDQYMALALLAGAFVGGIYFSKKVSQNRISTKNDLIKNIIIKNSNRSIIFVITLLLLKVAVLLFGIKTTAFFYIVYFLFGVGFAPAIGLVFSQVKEKLTTYNRTFIVTIICSLSFIPPAILAIVVWIFNKDELILIICTLLLSLFTLLVRKHLPEDAKFRMTDTDSTREWLTWVNPIVVFNFKHVDKIDSSIGKIFYKFAFLGLNSVFFFFLFFNHKSINFLRNIESHHIIAFSFLGLSVGTFYWGFVSKLRSSRKIILFYSNGLQLALCLIIIVINLCNQQIPASISCFFIFLFGVSCPWAIMLTWASEVFLLKTRASLLVLLPNFYRLGSLLLVLILMEPSIKTITNNTNSILIFNILLLFISTAFASQIPDQFGKEILPFEYGGKSIISTELRDNLNAIKINDDKIKYLETAIQKIAAYFKQKNVLGNLFYLTNIYYKNELRDSIICPDMNKNLSLINEETFKVRDCVEKDLEKIAFMHTVSDELVKQGKIMNFTNIIAQNDNIKGIMFWRSGQGQILQDYENPNFGNRDLQKRTIVIDLSDIEINHESGFPIQWGDSNWKEYFLENSENWYQHLIFLSQFTSIKSNLENILNEIEQETNQSFDLTKIKLLLIHYKLDAMLYPIANYFRYCIKPDTNKSEIVTLMTLKTVCALDKKTLGQLRGFTTNLMLKKSNIVINKQFKELRSANNIIALEEEHYKKNEIVVIQSMLQELAREFPELQEYNKFKYCINGIEHLFDVASLYMLMMKNQVKDTIKYHEKINMYKVLQQELEVVLSSLDILIDDKIHLNAILNNKDSFLKTIDSFNNRLHVRFDKTAFNIIAHELIKNGIKYSDKKEPFFGFSLNDKRHKGYISIEFKNNAKVTDEMLESFNVEFEDIVKGSRVTAGLRSVQRIINFYRELGWKFGAKRNSDATEIIVYIKIPSEFVSFFTPDPDDKIIVN